ncbi:NAD(P)(+) transhydrogenase (Re/Si-specific) subunit beta [Halogeometricum sp. S1BR25-6]|uniref:NAD(P) transhydrogenase subunit beta n=1 Tax=Halogeometricum salsisoli TaxID=2950536 RepID=A0ABU2GJN8_9EURY|nr:NAD(P)(+) transhydrogenase (Re/Si-specific) subunit beta [Halogeometricum sp. S1BR25-6]MDS0301038.1 NAD(P)(+) transhydrogenase (Re/Si-specific) subunit beta [Halogeometricum sp. S1BR25-6]
MPGIAVGLPSETLSLAYLAAGVLFILGLRDMTHPRTARRGNLISATGMAVAVGITILWFEILSPLVLFAALLVGAGIGTWLAVTVDTTDMPQLVGLFNGFGGGASALVAGAELIDLLGPSASAALPVETTTAAAITGLIGAVTFWGSVVAAGKLQGALKDPIRYSGENVLKLAVLVVAVVAGASLVAQNQLFGVLPAAEWVPSYWVVVAAASVLGVLLVIPIGGADMPVVIALLNACSGLAAATTGFALDNSVLIIAGTLVGASGVILTVIMCRSMNRTLTNVLFSGYGATDSSDEDSSDIYEGNVMSTSPEEVAMLLDIARRVVVVPGYGMAVGQAQHAVAELATLLEANDVEVVFGIHPVAGRMPGHMNVLLAEANVSYEQMQELEAVNPTFSETDVVIVTGANDVVNPTALSGEASPIAGMPVLHVWDAQTVIVNKRSLSPGYSDIPNPLFTNDNTYMLFGDAREAMQALVKAYKEGH